MTDIAQELSRRATPNYIREQAKEKALNKTAEWKEQMRGSPLALSLLGGLLGAAIGRSLARGRRGYVADGRFAANATYGRSGFGNDMRYAGGDTRYSAGEIGVRGGEIGVRGGELGLSGEMRDSGGAVRETANAVREKVTEGAQELKQRASGMVAGVREQIPSASELGDMASDNPAMIALGGLALGAFAALLLPVSRKERELLEPVKQRAGEAIGTLGEKIGDTVDEAQRKIGASSQSASDSSDQPDFSREIDTPVLPH